MKKPLAIDLFCGLGGWAEGFLSEGYDVIGFDIERHDYGSGGYPGQLVLQDVNTLSGTQFRAATIIVASPPCQAYSRRAMPFGALWREHSAMDDDGAPAGNYRGKDPISNTLFRACFRIAQEAQLPVIIENVKGTQEFMGPARWHYGSFYLWGDVPALMPITLTGNKNAAFGGGSWFKNPGRPGANAAQKAAGRISPGRLYGNNSDSRKAASAEIAKIPFPLAEHIARVYKP